MDASTWAGKQHQLCLRPARHCQQPPTWPLRTPAPGRDAGLSARPSLLTTCPAAAHPALAQPPPPPQEAPAGLCQAPGHPTLGLVPGGPAKGCWAGPGGGVSSPPLPGPWAPWTARLPHSLPPQAPSSLPEEPGLHCRVRHPSQPPRGQHQGPPSPSVGVDGSDENNQSLLLQPEARGRSDHPTGPLAQGDSHYKVKERSAEPASG